MEKLDARSILAFVTISPETGSTRQIISHAKRRLTSRQFLERYNQILAADGVVEFKTDNKGLFEFSLEEVEKAGWKLLGHTFDLHHDSAMNEGNVMTEYEEKFSSMGNPIYKLIAGR